MWGFTRMEREADRAAPPADARRRETRSSPEADAFALAVAPRDDVLEREAGGPLRAASGEKRAPPIVHDVLGETGRPLDGQTRAYFEPRLGLDLGGVRVHDDARAGASARAVDAPAYAVEDHVVLDGTAYAPGGAAGQRVLAHELAHVAQDRAGRARPAVRRYGTPIPDVASPTVKTMREWIDLVKKVEAANPGKSALEIAKLVMRSKYHSQGFDWLLPSTAGKTGVTAGGGVTADDVTTLSGEMTVTMPQGGQTDPSHIVTAIVAGAEKQAPGAGGAGGTTAKLESSLPAGLTQLDVASWAGDPGSAAGEWMTAHPHPKGGTTKQAYMDEFSPESDMMGDVDGVAMLSTTSTSGFVFDPTATLSSNLERFYYPANPREGKNRRFHIFCSVLGFGLEPDGVTLSPGAITTIDNRIKDFADWYTKNDPNITTWMVMNSPTTTPSFGGGFSGGFGGVPSYNPIWSEWTKRAGDWKWFAEQFRNFVQKNLTAEGK